MAIGSGVDCAYDGGVEGGEEAEEGRLVCRRCCCSSNSAAAAAAAAAAVAGSQEAVGCAGKIGMGWELGGETRNGVNRMGKKGLKNNTINMGKGYRIRRDLVVVDPKMDVVLLLGGRVPPKCMSVTRLL